MCDSLPENAGPQKPVASAGIKKKKTADDAPTTSESMVQRPPLAAAVMPVAEEPAAEEPAIPKSMEVGIEDTPEVPGTEAQSKLPNLLGMLQKAKTSKQAADAASTFTLAALPFICDPNNVMTQMKAKNLIVSAVEKVDHSEDINAADKIEAVVTGIGEVMVKSLEESKTALTARLTGRLKVANLVKELQGAFQKQGFLDKMWEDLDKKSQVCEVMYFTAAGAIEVRVNALHREAEEKRLAVEKRQEVQEAKQAKLKQAKLDFEKAQQSLLDLYGEE